METGFRAQGEFVRLNRQAGHRWQPVALGPGTLTRCAKPCRWARMPKVRGAFSWSGNWEGVGRGTRKSPKTYFIAKKGVAKSWLASATTNHQSKMMTFHPLGPLGKKDSGDRGENRRRIGKARRTHWATLIKGALNPPISRNREEKRSRIERLGRVGAALHDKGISQ